MKFGNYISSVYHKYIGRVIECARLYRLDINLYSKQDVSISNHQFKFFLATVDNLEQLIKRYDKTKGKADVVQQRFASGNYTCFAYEDTENAKIAYTRWLCKNEFYSDLLKMNFSFSKHEVLTLDSYTDPSYRKLGLHHAMNIEMLNWLKDNSDTKYVYMIIKCFIPHLTKIPLELGYKPVKTRIYLKKGALSDIARLVRSKLSGKAV